MSEEKIVENNNDSQIEIEDDSNESTDVDESVDSNESTEVDESDDSGVDWKARAIKAEALIVKNKHKNKDNKGEAKADEPKPDLEDRLSRVETVERKRDFGYRYKLSPEQVDFVFKVDPEPTEKTLSDVFVKSALKGFEKSRKIADNTPKTRTSSFSVIKDGKPLSKAERDAAYQEKVVEILKNKKSA